nr:DNA-directed DNA polymerase [Tanacetum cinerariifolium]
MLRACPHHGFLELTQIDTFYNGLTEQDQDSMNAVAGGNLLNKTTREALKIIKNKSKVPYSRSKSNVSRDNVSKTYNRIDKLADQISNLVEIVNKQVIAPAKAVEKTCVTCGGAHAYYDCIATDSNQPSVCTETGSFNQVSPPNRASHQIPPPGFALVQNNQNRYNQGQENYFNQANNFNQGNNFNRGNNFHNNQGYHAQMNNALKFQNQGFQNQPFSVPNNQIQQGVSIEFSSYMKSNEIMIKSMPDQINVLRGDFNKQEENFRRNLNNDMRSILGSFFQNQPSTLGTLLSNTVPNPKGKMKAVTTCSGLAYEGPSIPTNSPLEKVDEQNTKEITDKEHSNCPGSTAQVQPLVVPISIPKPDVRTQTKPTIPYPCSFADALLLMPKFASTIKSLLANKDKLFELAKVPLNENCSAMLLKKHPKKLGDLGKFLIPCDFPGMEVCYALADLGANINLEPLSIWKNLSLPELTPTRMTLELADRSITHPKGVAEDVFVKVGKFRFLTNFVVVDFEADPRVPLILGRSFLITGGALIDVYGEEITLRVNDESVTFNLNQTMRYSSTYDDNSVNRVDVIDIACEDFVQDVLDFQYNPKSSNPTLVSDLIIFESNSCKEPIVKSSSPTLTLFREIDFFLKEIKDSLNDDSILTRIENSFYDPEGIFFFLKIIIAKDLKDVEKEALINVLKSHKRAIAWKISDIKGIYLRFYTHKILMKDDYKPAVHSQRRVNPKIHDVIKKEVIKLLDTDQEKTTFTCPYGTFVYRRMPFGLCNAPGTFQRCMLSIFHDMIEKTMEVFMDDFLVFGDSFASCLTNLDKMLERCEETNLVLNWEKCHFMCREGIVLGHNISKSGIEVDRAKVDVISKLPHPTTVKGVRSFLGHAGFYSRFIQDFLKIARPMTHLLDKDIPFVFSKEGVDAFNTLKKKLTEASILVVPDWNLPFELMCDATLKYLLNKQDEKPRLLWWVLLLQEFDITILDKKGSENLAADHLSRLENPHKDVWENKDINENFPLETLGSLSFDYLSKWVEAKALPTNDAMVIVKFLKCLFSDLSNGHVWGHTSASHNLPSSDDWSSTGFQSWIETHFREDGRGKPCLVRVYGKLFHLPIELEHRAYWALKHVNFNLKTAGDHRKLQLNELSELRDQAYENSVIYKERMNKLHDSKIKNRIFNVGDQVLLFNSHLKILSGKLKTRWSGPFTITQVFPYGTIELSQPNGPNFKVNGHRVKYYFGGDIPSNDVPDLHTFPMDK